MYTLSTHKKVREEITVPPKDLQKISLDYRSLNES